MPGIKKERRAAVQAILNQWTAYADSLIANRKVDGSDQPNREDELFPFPKRGLQLRPTTHPKASEQAQKSPLQTTISDSTLGENDLILERPRAVCNDPNVARTLSEAPGLSRQTSTLEPNPKKRLRDESRSELTGGGGAEAPVSSLTSPATTNPKSYSAPASVGHIRKKCKSSPASGIAEEAWSGATNAPETRMLDEIEVLPDWYHFAKRPQHPKANERATWDRLKTLGELVKNLKASKYAPSLVREKIEEIYHEIDKLRFMDVSPYGLKRANLLDTDGGLSQIFKTESGHQFPTYVINDARGLYKKWMAQIFDGSNMFRGINNMVNEKRSTGRGPSIDKTHKIDWHFFGDGHLVNGDWFANQLTAVRDGAHGAAQGGISGIEGKGATSISMSGDLYAGTDKDELDNVWYSGTPQSKKGHTEKTANTALLMESQNSGLPVRVLRSMHLPKSNPYRPERGIRYDGLYTVKGYKCIDRAKQHFLFHLVRNPGQDPVRYRGLEKRPTENEMKRFDQEMKNYGKKGIWNN